jgi:UDP-N-acetylglucosamine:LPS N-acetylglucosamine transferase
MVDAGAALITQGPIETARAINSLLKDEKLTDAMALRSQTMARPDARGQIAALALALVEPVAAATRRRTA